MVKVSTTTSYLKETCPRFEYVLMELFLAKDVQALVDEYLADDRVLLKNKDRITFNTSVNVFVRHRQTPIAPGPLDNADTGGLESRLMGVRKRFEEAVSKFDERKQVQLASKQASKRYGEPTFSICLRLCRHLRYHYSLFLIVYLLSL